MSTSHSKQEAPGDFDVKTSKRRQRNSKSFFKRWFYDRNVLNLKPKFRVRHPVAWTLICLVAIVLVFWGAHRLSIHAEVSDFYPTTCLGDWQNPGNATGRAETVADPQASFTANDSASFNGSSSQIFCGGFLTSGMATSGNITNVGLTFIWQVGEQSPATSTGGTPPAGGDGTTSTTSSSDSSGQNSTTTIIAPTSTDTSTDTTTSGGSDNNPVASPDQPPAPQDVTLPPAPAPVDSPSSFIGNKLFSLLINKVFADDASDTIIGVDTSTDASTPPVILGPPLIAPLDSTSAPSSTDLASSTPTPPVVTAPTPPDQNFLQISYSLDGQLWIQLEKVNVNNWKNLTFTLPVNSWDDLSHLQIKIEGIPTTQDPLPPVYLDGMFVEVHYTSLAQPLQQPAGPILTDKSAYLPDDYMHVVGADPAGFVVIYDTSDPTAGPQYDYATQIRPDGNVDIDTATLHSGNFTLVETMDPQSCNVDSLAQCESSNYFVSETYVSIESPPGQ